MYNAAVVFGHLFEAEEKTPKDCSFISITGSHDRLTTCALIQHPEAPKGH
jgi:hypothetical protein